MDRVPAAILGGAIIIAAALLWTTNDQRYQGFAVEGEIYRLNTRTGEVIACNGELCMQMVDSDEYVQPNRLRKSLVEKALENEAK
jgi:hypothetical protein